MIVMELLRQAELGREYMRQLKNETVRLGQLCKAGIEYEELCSIVDKLSRRELEALQASFSYQLEQMFPPVVQMRSSRRDTDISDKEYLI